VKELRVQAKKTGLILTRAMSEKNGDPAPAGTLQRQPAGEMPAASDPSLFHALRN